MARGAKRDPETLVSPSLPRDVRLTALLILGASLVMHEPSLTARPDDDKRLASAALTPFLVDPPPPSTLGPSTPPVIAKAAALPLVDVAAIDNAVAAAIAESKLPGCVVTIGRRDRLLFQKAYGMRVVDPDRRPMTIDTIFDIASMTKPIATATSIMVLVDRGLVGLDEPVFRYLPEFWQRDKRTITVRQLLTHGSGFPAETIYEDFKHGRVDALRRIANTALVVPTGSRFLYSDIGFLILEDVVTRVSGQDLATFSSEAIFRPLGMVDTGYKPAPALRDRIAPTEYRDGGMITGEVHDPRAFFLGGVAGHAGLFATSDDLARYAQMILGEGVRDGARILSAETVRAMLTPHELPGGVRALGWDMQTRYSVNRGDSMSRRAVGHGGYTGTCLWIDPELDLFVLFLSNRVHPDGRGAVNPLIGKIGTIAGQTFGKKEPEPAMIAAPADAAAPPSTIAPAPLPSHVEVGIDVLKNEGFARLRGARVGLITNASGRDSSGTRTIDVLRSAEGVTLVALFAPEHGLLADVEKKIANGSDESSRLPVYSLYGDNFAPTDAMLAGIDTLVFDIQDVGARFYTYASTLHRTLAVAAAKHLRVVVLDRPNPLGGVEVAGPLPAAGELSFVNHHALPVRHGMTLGELAELIVADEHLDAKLDVVRMRGWRRSNYFDDTGLQWTPPSPNLRSVAETVLYPGVALVEGTNVSVGRGTETPFEVVGAPFIDDRFAEKLEAASLPGVRFSPTEFTPTASTHANKPCRGVRITVTDRAAFEPVRTGIALARALAELYPTAWNSEKLNGIIANRAVTSAIVHAAPISEIESMWKGDLDAFRDRRKKYLLYVDDGAEKP